MNKAARIVFSAVFFGCCALPLALYPTKKNTLEVEKRKLAEKPKLMADGKLNSDFSGDFDSWFSDHLPFRPQLLTAADGVRSRVLHSSAAGVITGKNGFIFSDTTVASYTGSDALTDRELNAIGITLSLLQEQCDARDAGFTFVPMPNKNTVYSEYMPSNYIRAELTDIERLYPVLETYGVNYADMLTTLTDAKNSGMQVYHKRDTHWNYLGALLGYNCIMESLGKEHKLYEGQLAYTVTDDWRGDLDKLLYPVGGGIMDEQYRYSIQFDDFSFMRPPGLTDTQAALANFMSDKEDNDTNFTSRKTTMTNGSKLYMVRDSFGRALLPYMIDNYDTATFVRTNLPNLNLVPMKGDFVYEIVERNLATVISTAPNMNAPLRGLAETEGEYFPDGSVLFAEDYPYGVRIFGALDESLISDMTRIYVKLTGDGGSFAYEAFPILETEELKKHGVTDLSDGCGVSMFLNKNDLPDGEYSVEVMTFDPLTGIQKNTGVLATYTVSNQTQEVNENEQTESG
ncbi:SGNH hydrolase-like domain-containing protein, acetyltransferase AlgX [Ruminococcus sp. YE71]|uniref:alginate O-acetyltransferase AlgX-related protein n=1 Tax=unclassified Ruminococcus TaxID=2608920 RepID=UPI00088A129F|nr:MULTISPECIES: hypothetical protein [unclassified Ruminococcus]SDA27716.1 SGNH hydrolase-like domain-containing protein, acetyltransferase AlgX [Ruminococcus sp. YE78]SFW45985.1 SGNH hydrolase-like domain-containing protein, acetyltransferase AlgX [Ruminococcus sp. YE71]